MIVSVNLSDCLIITRKVKYVKSVLLSSIWCKYLSTWVHTLLNPEKAFISLSSVSVRRK